MNLSPLDVAKHEFTKVMRGFDPAEVRAFLERVSDEITILQSQIAALQEQNRAYEFKITAYRDLEKSLRESLAAAQEGIKSSKEQSETERQNILREARIAAEEIKIAAEREILGLHEELRSLRLHRDAYVKRLRFLIKSQTELIDLIQEDDPEEPLKTPAPPEHTDSHEDIPRTPRDFSIDDESEATN